MKPAASLITYQVEKRILLIRGQKVMLDADLAALYGVPTKALNQAVKRHRDRFPQDFMFHLTAKEISTLNRSQIVTGSQKHRDPRFPPHAFTEHGALMLASVLNAPRAVEVSIYVVRVFVQLREMLSHHRDWAEKLAALERRLEGHDVHIRTLFDALRQLLTPAASSRRPIGFHPHR